MGVAIEFGDVRLDGCGQCVVVLLPLIADGCGQ